MVAIPAATFEEIFDWLTDRRGQRVRIEVGRKDPRAEEEADFVVLAFTATLGEVRTVEDRLHSTRAVRVVLDDDERHGIEIDPMRVERAIIYPRGAAMKVWQEGVSIAVVVA